MNSIIYLDRKTLRREHEKVYGGKAIGILYNNPLLRRLCLPLISKTPFFSAFYGWLQKRSFSKRKIMPFIKEFGIDATEFDDPHSFRSFNDFFVRKLKSDCRPVAPGEDLAIIPADGRYYFFENIEQASGFIVKGQKFTLDSLLENSQLAHQYREASMVIARLCPSDYHRFHFPCSGMVSPSRLINGWLYSVNPIALKRDINIFTKNKRAITEILSPSFGKVLFIEVGATNVGSIHQTYEPNSWQRKGDEKGFFSFGASSLVILFQKGSIIFDQDLLSASESGMEIRCLMGQRMGVMMGRG